MATASTDITSFKKFPIGGSRYLVMFQYTGPTSYTSGGEALSRTVARAAMEGISYIDFLVAASAGGTSYADCAEVVFEPINDGTNVGKFHFYNGADAHSHSLLITGGQGAGTALQIDVDSSSGIVGKQAATNRTLAGGAANVLTSAAIDSQTEHASSKNYTAYKAWFFGIGVA